MSILNEPQGAVASTDGPAATPAPLRSKERGNRVIPWLTTTDHKTIGTMYLVTSFLFFCIGGVMALFMRAELARPGLQIMSNGQFNQALGLSGFGTILGSVNFITTIICMRAPGMTMFRMPIFTWNVLLTGLLVLLAFPVLAAALFALEYDRKFGGHIFSSPASRSSATWVWWPRRSRSPVCRSRSGRTTCTSPVVCCCRSSPS